jgi:hypothetical protein
VRAVILGAGGTQVESTDSAQSAAATSDSTPPPAPTLDLSSLLDGTVTVTARTRDEAGNVSASASPANAVVKDVVAPPLTGVSYNDRALLLFPTDQILGTAQCGAAVRANRTVPSALSFGPVTAASNGSFTLDVAPLTASAYSYDVTATDLAGNTSAATTISGTALL